MQKHGSKARLEVAFGSSVGLGMWASQAMSRTLQEAFMAERHEQWMTRYGRTYKDAAEREMRLRIFRDNAFNKAGTRPYKLAINQFADLTNEEFRSSRNGYRMLSHGRTPKAAAFRYQNETAAPASIDWRKKGAVTAIKDQGQCDAKEGLCGIAMQASYPTA
ncbi:unnamed protein product [Thlaspi arvense]|uniref:Cathepsin propeptide inhibitor domain-containing protein n=1 Tax=Thlaspi arvense TaxID=13288 RepID=A0AAU9RL35_THLAR|nr:unnamed protein product [Thlaspi arvense]